MAEAIVNKLLHVPLTKLKAEARTNPESELAAQVRGLFDLHTGHTEEIRLDLEDVGGSTPAAPSHAVKR